MKRIKNILRMTAIAATALLLVNTAFAQRGGRMSGGMQGGGQPRMGGGGMQSQPRMNMNNGGGMVRPQAPRPMPQASQSPRPMPQASQPRPQFNQTPSAGGVRPVRPNNFPQQNTPRPTPPPVVNQSPAPQVHQNFNPSPRPDNFRPQPSPSSTARNYGNRNGYYNSGYRNGGRRPIVVNRFYYGGAYHPHPSYYRPFTPHFGIHINILPVGYYPFYWSSRRYFYNDGIFYQPFDGYYETIVPPLGVYVPVIPGGAYPVVINGINYYEYQGTYYQRVTGAASNYEVVGVNGLLKSDMTADSDDGDIISDDSIVGSSSAPALTELPSNFKTVTLNNVVYYVSPSGEYYTKNIDENGKVTYQVAAIEAKGN